MKTQVMIWLQKWFRKPSSHKMVLVPWGKLAFSHGNVENSPWSDQPIFWTVIYAAVAASIEQSLHKSVWKWSAELWVICSTMFDHKRDLVIKSFQPVFSHVFGNADIRQCHETCAFYWGSSLFGWIGSLLQLPVLKYCEIWWYWQTCHWPIFLWRNCQWCFISWNVEEFCYTKVKP